jgi:hypothetical protein
MYPNIHERLDILIRLELSISAISRTEPVLQATQSTSRKILAVIECPTVEDVRFPTYSSAFCKKTILHRDAFVEETGRICRKGANIPSCRKVWYMILTYAIYIRACTYVKRLTG